MNINLGTGGGPVTFNSTASGTTTSVNTGGGNDTVNIKSISSTTSLNTGAGANIVNVTSTAPTAGGTLANIGAGLILVGSGSDTFNIDDAGDSTGRTATLSATAFSGISGTINYSGAALLNVYLGSGADTLTVSNTASATTTIINTNAGTDTVNLQDDSGTTTVNTGTGSDTLNVNATHGTTALNTTVGGTNTINVGSLAPAISNGVASAVAGALTITGNGSDSLNVDDSGDGISSTSTLTSTALTGLAPATISYSHLANLAINTGTNADTFTVASTATGTATSLSTGTGIDTVNVRTTSSSLAINTGTGANVVNVGSLAPASSSVVSSIAGTVTVTGSGSDTLNFDNSGSSTGATGHINTNAIILGAAAVLYSNEAAININLGLNDNFTVSSTVSTTPVTINAAAADSIYVTGNSSLTTINTPAGNDTISLRDNGAATVVNNTSMIADAIGVGSTTPNLGGFVDNLLGAITLNGNTKDVVTVDDSGNHSAKTGNLTATTLTGLGTAGVTYSGVATLNIDLGLSGNAFTISQTAAATSTVINAGPGNNTIALTDDTGPDDDHERRRERFLHCFQYSRCDDDQHRKWKRHGSRDDDFSVDFHHHRKWDRLCLHRQHRRGHQRYHRQWRRYDYRQRHRRRDEYHHRVRRRYHHRRQSGSDARRGARQHQRPVDPHRRRRNHRQPRRHRLGRRQVDGGDQLQCHGTQPGGDQLQHAGGPQHQRRDRKHQRRHQLHRRRDDNYRHHGFRRRGIHHRSCFGRDGRIAGRAGRGADSQQRGWDQHPARRRLHRHRDRVGNSHRHATQRPGRPDHLRQLRHPLAEAQLHRHLHRQPD